jgi:hypothetical protein
MCPGSRSGSLYGQTQQFTNQTSIVSFRKGSANPTMSVACFYSGRLFFKYDKNRKLFEFYVDETLLCGTDQTYFGVFKIGRLKDSSDLSIYVTDSDIFLVILIGGPEIFEHGISQLQSMGPR